MSDKSLRNDFFLPDSLNASNAIIQASNSSGKCVTGTSQLLKEYLDILDGFSKNLSDDNDLNAEVSNDSSSEKVERPKIWSITDILGNSSDKCCNEISSPINEKSYDEPNYESSTHPITENKIEAEKEYSNDINLDDNMCIDDQSKLNTSIPKDAPAITDLRPLINVDSSDGWTRGTWMIDGVECSYEVLVFGNYRWYLCGTCRVRYSDEKTLHFHQYIAHVSVRDRPSNDGHCPFCGLDCINNHGMQQHLHKMHPYSCFFCHLEFPSQMDHMQHIIFTHPPGL